MPRSHDGAGRRVVVVGLGRFGQSVARTLHELRYDVTAIDRDERAVQEASDYVALAAQGDGTDEDLLRSLQAERSDVAVVAQGTELETSVLATLVLKRIGVPWVVAKATTELRGEVLRRVGADRVIFPERDAGIQLAHTLGVPSIDDYISLDRSSGVAKFGAPSNLTGRTLAEAHALCGAHLTILAVKRGRHLLSNPALSERIERGDELIVAGLDADIEAFVEAGLGTPAP